MVADVGDIPVIPYNPLRTCQIIKEHMSKIVKNGCRPLAIGGDHLMTYPILQAIKVRVVYRYDQHRSHAWVPRPDCTPSEAFKNRLRCCPFFFMHRQGEVINGRLLHLNLLNCFNLLLGEIWKSWDSSYWCPPRYSRSSAGWKNYSWYAIDQGYWRRIGWLWTGGSNWTQRHYVNPWWLCSF